MKKYLISAGIVVAICGIAMVPHVLAAVCPLC